MSAAAVPVAIDVLGRKQPVDRILEVGLGPATGLHQCDAGGRMRDEDMAQAVGTVAAELVELAGDVGDESGAGADVHDLGMHSAIITAGSHYADVVFAALQCCCLQRRTTGCGAAWQRT